MNIRGLNALLVIMGIFGYCCWYHGYKQGKSDADLIHTMRDYQKNQRKDPNKD